MWWRYHTARCLRPHHQTNRPIGVTQKEIDIPNRGAMEGQASGTPVVLRGLANPWPTPGCLDSFALCPGQSVPRQCNCVAREMRNETMNRRINGALMAGGIAAALLVAMPISATADQIHQQAWSERHLTLQAECLRKAWRMLRRNRVEIEGESLNSYTGRADGLTVTAVCTRREIFVAVAGLSMEETGALADSLRAEF